MKLEIGDSILSMSLIGDEIMCQTKHDIKFYHLAYVSLTSAVLWAIALLLLIYKYRQLYTGTDLTDCMWGQYGLILVKYLFVLVY